MSSKIWLRASCKISTHTYKPPTITAMYKYAEQFRHIDSSLYFID